MNARERIAVLLLLVLYWLMGITASIHKSNTYDELAHLTGGYCYLHTQDYRIHPENGVLPQKFAAFPLVFANIHFPSPDQDAWWHGDLWSFGFQFLFLSGNDADKMLLAGRSMIALLGAALGLVIFLWSRQLFGVRGAFLSLILFVFCPTMLAHGSLITSDIASALFLTLSVWSLWNLLHQYKPRWLLLTTISIAGIVLSKAVWLLLLPIAPALILVRFFFGNHQKANWKQVAVAFVGICVAVYLLIWSFYSFRYSAFAEFKPGRDQFLYTWRQVEAHPGMKCIEFGRQHHLLPAAFLYGTSLTLASVSRHSHIAFLNGQYSSMGWWYFFPYCFLVKTPLPLFLILGFAAAQFWRRKSPNLYATAPLFILLAVYWIFALRSEINLGQRYILPVYPAIYVLAGAAASVFIGKSVIPKIFLLASIAWFVFESLSIRPHYLAYFNQISGGPNSAYQHLADSSLDWGQDLPGLEEWLQENHKDSLPVYLAYFGTSSPEYYGISAISLYHADVSKGDLPQLRAGTYCISATMLNCLYNVPIGHWAVQREKVYQQLLESAKASTLPHDSEAWMQILDQLQRYRFARLAAFLRKREYDAQVGHSILIFHLNEADLQKALNGPPTELLPTIGVRGLQGDSLPPFL